MPERLDVVVVGAGISGLTTTHYLRANGASVAVVERAGRPGGVIESARHNGFLCEDGPNSALDSSGALSRLVASLEIEDRVVNASDVSRKRFVLKDGFPHLLPSTPSELITSKLFSARGKLQLLAEPFVRRRVTSEEESFAGFVERRFGREAVTYGADPFVSGVYAGNPYELGVRSAFPSIARYEDKDGGVIRGVMRAARQRKKSGVKRASMVSFDAGMQVLTDALFDRLGAVTRLNCEVVSIARDDNGWSTSIATKTGTEVLRSAAVVLSTPANLVASLVETLSDHAAAAFGAIPYAGVGVVHLGYPARQVGHDLDGFGLLVPSSEKRRILGVLFSSSLFPGRAPADAALLTVMMGGTRAPGLLDESEDALIEIAACEVNDILEISASPIFSHVRRRTRAIPQYTTRHAAVDEAVLSLEAENPGLVVAANFSGGVSVPDCIAGAERAVRRLSGFYTEPRPVS